MKPNSIIDKAFILKKTSLFKMLDLDLLLAISDKVGILNFKASDLIFDIGETASRMYFIVEGAIEIVDEKKNSLALLETPDFFGDEALLADQLRGYKALCKENAVLLTLTKTNLFSIITECPQVAIGLLQAYTLNKAFRPRNKHKKGAP